MEKTITKLEVSRLKLKWKPKCQICGRPLTFVYEGTTGKLGEKCPQCKQEYLVDTGAMEVIRILKAC